MTRSKANSTSNATADASWQACSYAGSNVTVAIWFNDKIGARVKRSLTACGH